MSTWVVARASSRDLAIYGFLAIQDLATLLGDCFLTSRIHFSSSTALGKPSLARLQFL